MHQVVEPTGADAQHPLLRRPVGDSDARHEKLHVLFPKFHRAPLIHKLGAEGGNQFSRCRNDEIIEPPAAAGEIDRSPFAGDFPQVAIVIET